MDFLQLFVDNALTKEAVFFLKNAYFTYMYVPVNIGEGKYIYAAYESNRKDMQNTCIGYLYRDASNYKVYNKAIVPGRFSEEQIDRILSSLEDGEYFLPRKVGFEEEKFDDTTEDDHLLFELTRNDFEPTSEKATVESSPEEIVKLFESAKGHWLEGVLL